MPVQKPTSCCFGGKDLTTLFITSAHIHLSQAQRSHGPLAGGLFAVETQIKGQIVPYYREA